MAVLREIPLYLCVCVWVCMCARTGADIELRDNPIIGDTIAYLDSDSGGTWTASASDIGLTISASVPGDLITDLQLAGVIPDPLYELNWLNSSLWDAHSWSYSTNFVLSHTDVRRIRATALAREGVGAVGEAPQVGGQGVPPVGVEAEAGGDVLLVFDGIKMGARIDVNGATLGVAADQFVRYSFPLSAFYQRYAEGRAGLADVPGAAQHQLREGVNTLTVTFDPSINVDGRFMACTGGWDWAPYSNTATPGNPGMARTFSRGIWKSVYMVSVSSAAIVHLVPHVFYTGPYPNTPLQDGSFAPFNVTVRTHFWAPAPTSGMLTVVGAWGATYGPAPLALPAGDSNITEVLQATSAQAKLWWPVGLGAQPLYNVSVIFTPSNGSALSAARRVGFRYAVLVTGNDTNPAYVANNSNTDGTDSQGMVIRVNGAAMYSRGANMIPMDELEGRYSAAAHRALVQSAVDANMNTLRVWGGGVFLPKVWYDACDELGIVVYHDMQFAQEGHSPNVSVIQDAEFRHQVRRLSNQCVDVVVNSLCARGEAQSFMLVLCSPSWIITDGCNECQVVIGTPTGIYATFVLTVVAEEDQSRVIWPSCPAAGWKAGVNRLSAHPNGSPLGLLPSARPPQAIQRTFVSTVDGALTLGMAQSCNYSLGYDVTNADGAKTAGASEDVCCAACWADPQCTSVVFWQGQCYLKYGGDVIPNPGRVLCAPQGKPAPPPPPHSIETHGPYQHGGGFPAVNGDTSLDIFSSNIPLSIQQTDTGLQYENTYASEFGCSVFSSFESMSPTLNPSHWGIHGGDSPDNCTGSFEKNCTGSNVMAQRNYPCDNIITVYFGADNFDAVGLRVFQKHLWQCMIGQALNIKQNIESRRAQNQFGSLIWQLNEVWPTGGWGSVEYGTVGFTPGQVLGGRWKPLHYWLTKSIYTDVIASCSGAGLCFVKNDFFEPFDGQLTISQVELATGVVTALVDQAISLAGGPGVTQWFPIDVPDGHDFVLTAVVADSNGAIVSDNVIPLLPPLNMTGLPDGVVTAKVSGTVEPDGTVTITLTASTTALYVTLTTLAQGRFSDNAFLMLPGTQKVHFIPVGGPVELSILTTTLRVEHVAMYR